MKKEWEGKGGGETEEISEKKKKIQESSVENLENQQDALSEAQSLEEPG